MLQFLSGHAFLAKHNALIGPPSGPNHYGPQLDPECRLCDVGQLQSPAHLLSDCGYFLPLWSQIFRAYTVDPPFTFPISKLIKFLISLDIEDLLWEDEVKI